jgi:hypothetical protein
MTISIPFLTDLTDDSPILQDCSMSSQRSTIASKSDSVSGCNGRNELYCIVRNARSFHPSLAINTVVVVTCSILLTTILYSWLCRESLAGWLASWLERDYPVRALY